MTLSDSLTHRMSVMVVVLAAGASSRMGQHKLLLPLAGKPLIVWSALAASASRASDVLIILGRDAAAVQTALPPNRYRTIINADFERGQGTSLALAASAAPHDTVGIVVVLADQPFMDASSIDRILVAAETWPNRIIMGSVNSHTGHPVYLPRRLFAELRALSGDIGARALIAREREATRAEPLANPLAHFDVDTGEDYQRALEMAYLLESSPA